MTDQNPSPFIDESLKAFQLIHRSLIAVAAGLLLFVISPDRIVGPYEGALREFHTLEEVIPKLGPAMSADIEDAYSGSELASILIAEEDKSHIALGQVEYSVASEELELQFAPPMYGADSKQKIDDYYRYLKTVKFDSSRLYGFNDPELRQTVDDLISHALVPISQMKVGLYLNNEYKQVKGTCTLSVPVSAPDADGAYRSYMSKPIKCHTLQVIAFKRALEMLKSSHLFEERNGYVFPLPAMSKVWDDISGKEMTVAEGILERKAAAEKSSNEGTVSVLGLSLNARAAAVAGPLIELFIVLYLVAHVKHINSLKRAELVQIRSFPDIGISSGVLGTLLISCTIALFPVAVADMVIIRFFPPGAGKIALISIYSVFYLALSTLCITGLKKLSG